MNLSIIKKNISIKNILLFLLLIVIILCVLNFDKISEKFQGTQNNNQTQKKCYSIWDESKCTDGCAFKGSNCYRNENNKFLELINCWDYEKEDECNLSNHCEYIKYYNNNF